MKRILKLGLNLCAIFLIVSCGTGCKSFEWDAKPYSGDSINLQLIKFNGEIIKCDAPAFDEMTCFDSQNMADLRTAIDKVKMKKTDRLKINKLFKRIRGSK